MKKAMKKMSLVEMMKSWVFEIVFHALFQQFWIKIFQVICYSSDNNWSTCDRRPTSLLVV